MKDDNYNSHSTCKAMQNAALKQILKGLQECIKPGCIYKAKLLYILNSMEEIISVYKCVPCECLNKRILLLKQKIFRISEIDVKTFISEVETFLNSDSIFEITLKDNSSHKI